MRRNYCKDGLKYARSKIVRVFVAIVLIVATYYYLLIDANTSYSYGEVQEEDENLNTTWDFNKSVNYLWRPNSSVEISNDRIGAQLKWTKKFMENKTIGNKSILLVFGKPGYHIFWSTDNKVNCPGFSIISDRCNLTISKNPRRVKLSMLNKYDAIIYSPDYQPSGGKLMKKRLMIPEIVYTEESPNNLKYTLGRRTLLATYYRGSDIVTPYSKWVGFDDKNVKHFGVTRNSSKTDLKSTPTDYAAGKTHFAVIFVSNCRLASNNRLGYVYELKKHVAVDIFGACGVQLPCKSNPRTECLNKVVRKYKFYLSFENSNCRDYITEKFYDNALKNDVLPVVLGAHPDDYRYSAPPHSYINVEDFESPKHLAQFLLRLDKNNELYNEYFRWKGTGEFYDAWKDLFCRLCGMLFYADFVPPPMWKKKTSWRKVDTCLPPGKWYWGRK